MSSNSGDLPPCVILSVPCCHLITCFHTLVQIYTWLLFAFGVCLFAKIWLHWAVQSKAFDMLSVHILTVDSKSLARLLVLIKLKALDSITINVAAQRHKLDFTSQQCWFSTDRHCVYQTAKVTFGCRRKSCSTIDNSICHCTFFFPDTLPNWSGKLFE